MSVRVLSATADPTTSTSPTTAGGDVTSYSETSAAAHDDRRRLERDTARERGDGVRLAGAEAPRDRQAAHVRAGDLGERRVALAAGVAAVARPVLLSVCGGERQRDGDVERADAHEA